MTTTVVDKRQKNKHEGLGPAATVRTSALKPAPGGTQDAAAVSAPAASTGIARYFAAGDRLDVMPGPNVLEALRDVGLNVVIDARGPVVVATTSTSTSSTPSPAAQAPSTSTAAPLAWAPSADTLLEGWCAICGAALFEGPSGAVCSDGHENPEVLDQLADALAVHAFALTSPPTDDALRASCWVTQAELDALRPQAPAPAPAPKAKRRTKTAKPQPAAAEPATAAEPAAVAPTVPTAQVEEPEYLSRLDAVLGNRSTPRLAQAILELFGEEGGTRATIYLSAEELEPLRPLLRAKLAALLAGSSPEVQS